MDHDATDTDTDTWTDAEEREEAAGAERAREHTEDEIAEIEAERERRLDPANRPENAVIDNSDAELPTVRHFEELNAEDEDDSSGSADDDGEERKATSDPSQKFKELEYSEEEVEEMAAERERRLDPENRPDNVEVDNTQRTFDTEEGRFVDDGEDA